VAVFSHNYLQMLKKSFFISIMIVGTYPILGQIITPKNDILVTMDDLMGINRILYDRRNLSVKPMLDTKNIPPSLLGLDNFEKKDFKYAHALNMTLFATRYGSTPHALGSPYYALTSDNVVPNGCIGTPYTPCKPVPNVSGLGVMKYLECYNEPEKTWRDLDADITNNKTYFYMSPAQYAALVSADFDGHCSTLMAPSTWEGIDNIKLGVKNADPTMKFALGGMWNWHGKYIEDMCQWFQAKRPCGDLPFDVVNFHHYSTQNSKNALFDLQYENYRNFSLAWGGGGIAPEEDDLKMRLILFRSKLLGNVPAIDGKEFWWSEYGYDSENTAIVNNPLSVPDCTAGPYPADFQKTQAQWNMRTVLIAAASKSLHRTDLFELRDNTGPWPYQNSGTYNYAPNFTPKRGLYYLMTLKNVLGEYHYVGDGKTMNFGLTQVNEPNDVLDILQPSVEKKPEVFKFEKGDKVTYAIWSPETCDRQFTASVKFKFTDQDDAKYRSGSILQVQEWSETGYWTDWSSHITLINGNIQVNDLPVSGTPIFFEFGVSKTSYVPNSIPAGALLAVGSCCDAVELSWPAAAASQHVGTYRIYYRLGGHTNLDFLSPELVLYTDAIAGNQSRALVNGLKRDEKYTFWVVPVSIDGLIPNGNIPGVTTIVDGCNYGGVASCLLDINSPGTTIAYGSQDPTAIAQANNLLSLDDGCNTLDRKNPDDANNPWPSWNFWNWGTSDPNETSITITFGTPVDINQVYYSDFYGQDGVVLEMQDCCNAGSNNWMYLSWLPGDLYGVWRSMQISAGSPIKKLRIRKQSEGSNFGKLFLCGKQTQCDPPILTTEITAYPDIKVRTSFKDESIVHLTWDPIPLRPSKPEKGNQSAYIVRYSEKMNEDGSLSDPIEQWAFTSPKEAFPSTQINGLNPATQYFGQLHIPSTPNREGSTTKPCGDLAIFKPVSFTFGTRKAEERNFETKSLQKTRISIFPNPTNDLCQIDLTSQGYENAILTNLNGQMMRQLNLHPSDQSFTMNLETLPAGLYFVIVSGRNMKTVVSKVVRE
jgi:Secretion system C-terminal sorting domain